MRESMPNATSSIAFCGGFYSLYLERGSSQMPHSWNGLHFPANVAQYGCGCICVCCPSIQKIDTLPSRPRCDVHLYPKPLRMLQKFRCTF